MYPGDTNLHLAMIDLTTTVLQAASLGIMLGVVIGMLQQDDDDDSDGGILQPVYVRNS